MDGVDVSKWNGKIDWDKVAKAGYGFAFVKSSEGRTGKDPLYRANIKGARDAGLLCAPYHFARPDNNSAADEAAHFLDLVMVPAGSDEKPFPLPAVLDLECAASKLSPKQMNAWALEWMRIVDAAVGRPSILYTYPAFVSHLIQPSEELLAHPLWIADYSKHPPRIGQWKEWYFWQYSATGSVPGISTHVDLNRMRGSEG